MNKLFFELISVAIGTRDTLSRCPSEHEWWTLYKIAEKQALLGVSFAALRRLGADMEEGFARIGISKILYMTWMGTAVMIQQRNEQMDMYTNKVLVHFREEGFACTALKGQGIAQLYGPLASLRQSGDVDVWVYAPRQQLYEHSLKMFGKLKGLTYHHIHYPMINDCEVEAHTWPAFFTNPVINKRFQKYCMMNAPANGCEDRPSLAFNRVFILQHCFGHFCSHGVGLRQLLDYYYVLMQGFSEDERKETMRWIVQLGMKRFTAAMMWLCKEVFMMPEDNCLCKPNEKYGRFLLSEVMLTGNMGHQDKRVDQKKLRSAFGRYLHNIKRDWQVIRIAPSYALWEPIWGIYQFTWVRIMNLRYNK